MREDLRVTLGGLVMLAGLSATVVPTMDASGQICLGPTWTEAPALPHARGSFAMASDPQSQRLIVFGGFDGFTREYFGDTWEFDSSSWRRILSPGPSARDDMYMSFDSTRRKMVLYGGFNGSTVFGDTWEYDVGAASWTQVNTAASPGPRRYASLAYDPDRSVTVLFGGLLNNAPNGETWLYTGTNWQRLVINGPSPRRGAAMAFDPVSRRVILFGGLGPGNAFLGDTWAFNGVAWTQIAGPAPSARHASSMAFDPDRNALRLVGGDNGQLNSDVWEFNQTGWTQFNTTQLPARSFHQIAYDYARGSMAVFGGVGQNQAGFTFLADMRYLKSQNWVLRTDRVAPPARAWSGIAFDSGRGRALMFGGSKGAALLGDTWFWDGQTWSTAAGASPSPRQRHALTFDPVRGNSVLFGGLTAAGASAETWIHNGSAWSAVAGTGPTARRNHAMTFDAARGVSVLFGGEAAVLSSDTWTFDGAAWTQATPGLVPPARGQHAMAFDRARNVVVLFGGLNGAGTSLGDTWEWNGTNWSQVATTGPSARFGHAMAFDPNRQRTVLYGGFSNATTRLADVWEWNGTAWTAIGGAALGTPAPNPRGGHAMTFDAARSVVLVAAGDDAVSTTPLITNGGDDDLWQLGGAGPRIANVLISRSRPAGSSYTQSVQVVSSAAVTYQWRKNGANIVSGGNIAGANGPLLSVSNLSIADAGGYDCVVSSACGSAISSRSTLSIGCGADFDDGSGTGRPDGGVTIEDIIYYVDLWQGAVLAADVDDGSGTGTPDGGTTIEDLLYFLSRFDEGC